MWNLSKQPRDSRSAAADCCQRARYRRFIRKWFAVGKLPAGGIPGKPANWRVCGIVCLDISYDLFRPVFDLSIY